MIHTPKTVEELVLDSRPRISADYGKNEIVLQRQDDGAGQWLTIKMPWESTYRLHGIYNSDIEGAAAFQELSRIIRMQPVTFKLDQRNFYVQIILKDALWTT